jgi:hydrogenase maturation protease
VRAPTLIIGYGNPSRGDDALGPTAIAALERRMARKARPTPIEYLTDFQLQIEFVTDLAERERIVFIDAAANGAEPFSFLPLAAREGEPMATHALSPASLLTVFQQYHQCAAPPCFLLAVRGYAFELGAPLSLRAQRNLDAALAMLERWIDRPDGHVAPELAAQPMVHDQYGIYTGNQV